MTPLRARMIADMISRDLGSASQTSHLRACKRFAAWLERSPETATPDDVKYFQQHLIESGTSICMRNLGVVTLTFLGQNIEAFENMFYCISTTYEILSPIKKTKYADN